ncbi:MAG: zinc ribbon domain-containing protein [Gaiellaceae bacterium]
MDAPVETGGASRCPRCSSGLEPGQEYCLECGLRLPHDRPGTIERASTGLAARRQWAGSWLLPAALGLVLAVVGTGAAIAISSNGERLEAVSTATGGSLTAPDSTPTLTAPEPTTGGKTTAAPPPTTTPTPSPRIPAAISWPRGRRGWTIVLLSLSQDAGRSAAVAKAEEAREGGLRRVGILNSSRFASLHPGYYVVFQGVFESEPDAASSLQRARTVFPAAYQRAIVP